MFKGDPFRPTRERRIIVYPLSLPRPYGRAAAALAIGLVMAVFAHPPASAKNLEAEGRAVEPGQLENKLAEIEHDLLLARAVSLESMGRYVWTHNLSAFQARARAAELREVAGLLMSQARAALAAAGTAEEMAAATLRLELVSRTSAALDEAADRLSQTRGVRRKQRILALDLSRDSWIVFRRNELILPKGAEIVPGGLFKENEPAAAPREKALLEEPDRDFLTYKRGAIDTDVLVERFHRRVPRIVTPVPESDLYYDEGALALSPLDKDHRSAGIWWSPPPEELAWRVEQW